MLGDTLENTISLNVTLFNVMLLNWFLSLDKSIIRQTVPFVASTLYIVDVSTPISARYVVSVYTPFTSDTTEFSIVNVPTCYSMQKSKQRS